MPLGVKLHQVRDVQVNEPADGQALVFSEADRSWTAQAVSPDTQQVTIDQNTPTPLPTTVPSTASVTQTLSWYAKQLSLIIGGNWLNAIPASLSNLLSRVQTLETEMPDPSNSVVALSTTTSGAGASTLYSRSDHRHPLPSASALATYIGSGINNTSVEDTNSAASPIINSSSDTIDGLSVSVAAGSTYLVTVSFEIACDGNAAGSIWNFETKFNFESTFRTVSVTQNTSAVVSYSALYTPASTTSVSVNLWYGGAAGSEVPANTAKLIAVKLT